MGELKPCPFCGPGLASRLAAAEAQASRAFHDGYRAGLRATAELVRTTYFDTDHAAWELDIAMSRLADRIEALKPPEGG